ncbi:hypothetical protein [Gynuella sp.]|uniref:hypothetical protein n=1 Tax=Gynuella sp. TaxID=2969146 RepID=UPI003D0CBE4E
MTNSTVERAARLLNGKVCWFFVTGKLYVVSVGLGSARLRAEKVGARALAGFACCDRAGVSGLMNVRD